MRFALLGNHPDGLAFAGALVDSGRHQLVTNAFAVRSSESIPNSELRSTHSTDLEEILADPSIEALIVAGPLSDRPALLRRALQSERHVVCVHPSDRTPEVAYEAAMICQDVRRVLVPLFPDATHPAVARLAEFIDRGPARPAGPVGRFRLLEMERTSTGEVLIGAEDPAGKLCFPGWDVLRCLGGEIAEVSVFAAAEDAEPDAAVLLSGQFQDGGLFQTTLLPNQSAECWRLTVVGANGRAELLFPQGRDGPAQLGWRDQHGEHREEYWERWDPWPTLVKHFEQTVEPRPDGAATPLDWQDETRALELDDSARRSVQKRRVSLLEYPEANEEVGFKGTMTLVGCATLWVVVLLLIASRWVPLIGWLIIPLLAVFLGLQLLRYVVPTKQEPPPRN